MILLIFFFLSLLIFCCLFLNTVTILNMAKKSKNYYKYFSNFFIRIELELEKNKKTGLLHKHNTGAKTHNTRQ